MQAVDTAQLAFPSLLGELVPVAYADIVLLNGVPPTPLAVGNLPWQGS